MSQKKCKLTEMTDVELMILTGGGNRNAFSEIVNRHQQPLMNFFCRLGVNRDAEDLVQDTFVRLYKYKDRYKPEAKFTTFLYLLARQVRVDYIRKGARQSEIVEGFESSGEAVPAEYDRFRGLGADMEESLLRLPETMREVLVLSVYQGFKYAEISEMLGVPVGTVKSRVFTALQKMREELNAARRKN